MKPLRALMVDLDGTLARTANANTTAYWEALREVGVSVESGVLEARIQGRHWRQFLPTILAESGVDADPAAISRRKAEIYVSRLRDVELNVPLMQLLLATRQYLKTALVTTAANLSVTALIEAHQLAHLFDTVVTGDDVRRHKPDPEAYLIAAARLVVQPEEFLVVEDSDLGVASAKAFGGHVIQIVF